ncbi:MAG: 2-amino-4-hydroxy-6-hydroxymethyldihydropteridine diphosphokinase [Prevotella sp.]|nr:2-amino-4-hydroxy-6-hydroxymethyldihydropteridine diphosphokinase [Prevotella sp.]
MTDPRNEKRAQGSVHQVYLSLGSNLGSRQTNLRQAIRLIDERVGEVTRQSSFLETEPWGFQSDNKFLNAVILCQTSKAPREVLEVTQQIERDMGRKQKSISQKLPKSPAHYADRPIDIDILLYDDLTIDEPDLKIPHPLMRQRDFVMIPLREIKDDLK